jgi:hypothetical protein
MDGCYWSGGSEIKWEQLDRRGDAGGISLARFVIIPSQKYLKFQSHRTQQLFDWSCATFGSLESSSPMRDGKAEADEGRRVAFIGSYAHSTSHDRPRIIKKPQPNLAGVGDASW